MDQDKETGSVFNTEGKSNEPDGSSMSGTKKTKFPKKAFLATLVVIYSLLLIGITFFATRFIYQTNIKRVLSSFHNPNSPLFLNLTGTLKGQITAISGDKAWVTTDKGGKIILSIKDPVSILGLEGSKLTEIGSSLDKVLLNQEAYIQVRGFGPGYTITSITYPNGNLPQIVVPDPMAEPANPATKEAETTTR